MLHKRASEQTGSAPGHETRYLTTLIAELEARQGVISYVELAGYSTEADEQRPQPSPVDSGELAVNYTVDHERAVIDATPPATDSAPPPTEAVTASQQILGTA